MEYIFGNIKRHSRLIHILKTVGTTHTDLTGSTQIKREYSDSIIVDDFTIVEKYLTQEDSEGRCYDYYEIKDHNRYIDYFTPMREQIATDINDSQNALCDLSADLDEALADIENALCELSE